MNNEAFPIIRVSAEDQLKGYGPGVQWEDDILPAAAVLGLKVSEKYRRIIQESATGWERIKFEAVVREAIALHAEGAIGAIIFPRVDRETRFIFGSFPLLTEVIKSGLRVYFARERLALDPNDPESVERYLNKATQAQAYVQTMKANTSRAKKKLLREGKLPQGTGPGLYGFKLENKRRIPLEFEVKVVEKIFGMVAEGKSLFAVAKELNKAAIPTKASRPGNPYLWHPLTIKRIVKNPAYTGKTYFGTCHRISKAATLLTPKEEWVLLPDATPAIITQQLFDAANLELTKPKLRPGRAKKQYLLKSHAFCSKCGRPLIGSWLSKKYRYYQCSGARPTAAHGRTCDARYVRADWLENSTWAELKRILQEPELILDQVKREMHTAQEGGSLSSVDAELAEVEHRLRSYPGQKRRLLEAFEIEAFEKNDVLDALNKLQYKIEDDTKKQTELKQARDTLLSLAQVEVKIAAFCQNANFNLENCSPENKRLALDMLDIKAFASPGHLEIKGVIPQEFVTIEQTSA